MRKQFFFSTVGENLNATTVLKFRFGILDFSINYAYFKYKSDFYDRTVLSITCRGPFIPRMLLKPSPLVTVLKHYQFLSTSGKNMQFVLITKLSFIYFNE